MGDELDNVFQLGFFDSEGWWTSPEEVGAPEVEKVEEVHITDCLEDAIWTDGREVVVDPSQK